MSLGIHNAYKEVLLATSALEARDFDERVNKVLVNMIIEELNQQSTLCGVTQTVVEYCVTIRDFTPTAKFYANLLKDCDLCTAGSCSEDL